MQTIGSLWWVWLAGMLACWGFIGFMQLRQLRINRKGNLDQSFEKSTGAGTNMLVGFRYLGFVFLVLLVFSLAVKLITWAA